MTFCRITSCPFGHKNGTQISESFEEHENGSLVIHSAFIDDRLHLVRGKLGIQSKGVLMRAAADSSSGIRFK